jgi:hypothetical protein
LEGLLLVSLGPVFRRQVGEDILSENIIVELLNGMA